MSVSLSSLRAGVLLAALLATSAPALFPLTAGAQEAPPPPRTPLFTWTDAAILGGFAATTVAIVPLDRSFARRLQRPNVQENRFLGDVSTVVRNVATPGSVIIGVGLYAVGRLTRNDRAADLGLHGTEALLVANGVGSVLKGILGRARPYRDVENSHDFQLGRGFRSGDYRSFPSGHTIAAFAAAAAVTSETDRWWPGGSWAIGTLMYGGAAVTGASRMYNNRHWASDVLVGAAIGTISGLKVVRWQHANEGNRLDRIFLGGTVTSDAAGARVVRLSVAPLRLGR